MMRKLPRSQDQEARSRGFTLLEALVCLAVAVALLWVVLPLLSRPAQRHPRIKCVNNLKNIGLAFRIFATDHDEKFPMALAQAEGGSMEHLLSADNVWRHFAALSNELSSPRLLICPSEAGNRKTADAFSIQASRPGALIYSGNTNLSYFVGLDANEKSPVMLLAGDRNLTNADPLFSFGRARMGSLGTNHGRGRGAGWSQDIHRSQGNIVYVDGSVQQFDAVRLRVALRESGDTNKRIAVPD